jgi:hypothetical protein
MSQETSAQSIQPSATQALFQESAQEYAQLAAAQKGHPLARRLKTPAAADLGAIAQLVGNLSVICGVAAQEKAIDASALLAESKAAIKKEPWLKTVAQDFLAQTDLDARRRAALMLILG